MKLKQAIQSLHTMCTQAENRVFDDLMLHDMKIIKSKKNKKKQRIVLTVKTTWQVSPTSVSVSDTQTDEEKPLFSINNETPEHNQVAETEIHHDEIQIIQQNQNDEIEKLNQMMAQLKQEMQSYQNENKKLKQENQSIQNENKELKLQVLYFQEESEKQQKIIARKEEIIAEVRKEIYEIKQSAKNHIPQYVPAKNNQAALLQFGQETDLYENEILSFTRKALQYALQNHTYEKSRYRHILEDVLCANPLDRDQRAEKERELHKILHDYQRMDSPTRQALLKFGFTIHEQGAHYKFMFLQQSRYTFTASKTSSDIHGGKNCAREIGRLLF